MRVSYQGEPGANSHLACLEVFPDCQPFACATFEDALAAVKSGEARYAMIPIENSVAGRVADIHHLLPKADLFIVGEHFLRVRHSLMALPGASLTTVKRALSHTQALGQCRTTLRRLGLTPVPEADTAGSARMVSRVRRSEPGRDRFGAGGHRIRPRHPDARHRGRRRQHDPLHRAAPRTSTRPSRATGRSSPPSSSACATSLPRSTRRSAASPPTAST